MKTYLLTLIMSLSLPFESVGFVSDYGHLTISARPALYGGAEHRIGAVRISWRCTNGTAGVATVPHTEYDVQKALEVIPCYQDY